MNKYKYNNSKIYSKYLYIYKVHMNRIFKNIAHAINCNLIIKCLCIQPPLFYQNISYGKKALLIHSLLSFKAI